MKASNRTPLVIGNWKMNGSIALVNEFNTDFSSIDKASVEVAICPPSVLIERLSVDGVAKGAQDVSSHDNGAYTGELSAQMLRESGCEYVIVGHSERREYHNESDALVAEKAKALLNAGLTPVICVGEPLSVREAGNEEVFVGKQLSAVTAELDSAQLARCVIAYEPVWAIGTGKTATTDQAQAVHAFIRQQLAQIDSAMAEKVRILYGGSVKPDNAKALFSERDIDGGLIGGASLKTQDFTAICLAAN